MSRKLCKNESFQNDFCFVVVSYNQEQYVYQHLESIRFLIEKFGREKKIQLVFSDDASTDNTVSYAVNWIKKNNNLFYSYEIVTHDHNVGTIRNMQDAIDRVNAKAFKQTACDDLYYKNNIFDLYKKGEIVISPTIHFFEGGGIEKKIISDYLCFLKYRDNINLKYKIKKMLDYNQCIPSPGVFIKKKMWDDEGFLKFITQFTYIEDVPEWYYFFNIYKKEFSVYIDDVPYVLYRRNVGVSCNIKKKGNPIDEDYRKIRKLIRAKQDFLPRFINPYCFIHFIKNKLQNPIWKIQKEIRNSLQNWDENLIGAEEHIEYIQNMAIEFYKIPMNSLAKEEEETNASN